MADTDPPAAEPAAKKPARRRATTPAKAATAKPRGPRIKAEPTAETPAPAKSTAKAPPKPRSSKRTAPTTSGRKTATRKKDATVTDKVGGKWGIAAIAGGLAAAGAAAALLTLRGSTAKPGDPATPKPGDKAHQPDGTDSSKSFKAGIADENTIPD